MLLTEGAWEGLSSMLGASLILGAALTLGAELTDGIVDIEGISLGSCDGLEFMFE